jgi:drug/metabolite transporter (DMT)-like permease
VSTSTLLSSSNSVFTFVLSVIFLREPFSLLKLACTALNLGGVALLVLYDPASSERPRIHTTAGSASATGTGDPGTDSFAGNCMAVVSAACSAAYAVQLKRMLPADSDAAARVSMPMLFGFLGITVPMCVCARVGVSVCSLSLSFPRGHSTVGRGDMHTQSLGTQPPNTHARAHARTQVALICMPIFLAFIA